MARIGFNLKFNQARRGFFDRTSVTKATDRATRSVLSRFGSYVRTRARHSIRKRKRASRPGEPPSSHAGGGNRLRNGIFFGYNANRQSVVIGPARLNQVHTDGDGRPVAGTVPAVLEYGGRIGILEEWTGRGWSRRDLRRRGAVSDVGALRNAPGNNVFHQGRPIRRRTVTIAARPYMGPAFERELADQMPDLWKNSIRKAA